MTVTFCIVSDHTIHNRTKYYQSSQGIYVIFRGKFVLNTVDGSKSYIKKENMDFNIYDKMLWSMYAIIKWTKTEHKTLKIKLYVLKSKISRIIDKNHRTKAVIKRKHRQILQLMNDIQTIDDRNASLKMSLEKLHTEFKNKCEELNEGKFLMCEQIKRFEGYDETNQDSNRFIELIGSLLV